MRHLLLVVLTATACQQKPAVPSCDAMAEHVFSMFTPPDKFSRDVRDAFATRCREDKWSDEVRTCIGTTAAVTEPRNCKQKLDTGQAKRLDDAIQAIEVAQRKETVPQVCVRYEQVLAKALACDKLPADMRQALADRFAQAKAEWKTMPDKSELGPICSSGISALKSASLECPGAAQW